MDISNKILNQKCLDNFDKIDTKVKMLYILSRACKIYQLIGSVVINDKVISGKYLEAMLFNKNDFEKLSMLEGVTNINTNGVMALNRYVPAKDEILSINPFKNNIHAIQVRDEHFAGEQLMFSYRKPKFDEPIFWGRGHKLDFYNNNHTEIDIRAEDRVFKLTTQDLFMINVKAGDITYELIYTDNVYNDSTNMFNNLSNRFSTFYKED